MDSAVRDRPTAQQVSTGIHVIRRCIVARLGIDMQRRKPFGRNKFNFYLPPLPIACWFVWTVPSTYWLRSSIPIFVATSANSFGLSMVNVRPPVTSVISDNTTGPIFSSGVAGRCQKFRCHKSGRRLP